MLQKRPYKRKVEIVARNDCRQCQAQPVANQLQRHIVDVRAMARQKDDAVLVLFGFFGNGTQTQHLLGRHVDA